MDTEKNRNKNPNESNQQRIIKRINWEKIRQLPTMNDLLDAKYGKEGTPSREAFDREAYEYYYRTIAEMEAEEEKERSMNKREELVTNI